MSRVTTLIVLGVIIFLAPFSGLPYSWLDVLFPVLGVAVFAIGFSMRRDRVREHAAQTQPASTPSTPDVIHGPSPLA